MKIAVCDDENKIVEEITSFIKKEFPASEVKAFSDGETFLASSEERPEVLLLDIDMPGIKILFFRMRQRLLLLHRVIFFTLKVRQTILQFIQLQKNTKCAQLWRL